MNNAARSPRKLMLFCAGLFALMVAWLVASVVHMTHGVFTYALDDPYIHLALAENLARGHYGINAGEYASPSSSVIWPVLLIPFSGTRIHQYLPLVLNMLFGLAAAALIGYCVARWPPQVDEQGRMPWWNQAVTCVLLIFIANLASLTLLGMEHVLQVLLSICCAVGVMEAIDGRPVPRWCIAAAVIAPAVRYEDLSLTMVVCLALAGQRRWKAGAAVMGLSVAPLVGFSIYLKRLGLPGLPLSVLVKAGAFQSKGLSGAMRVLGENVVDAFSQPERMALTGLTGIFAVIAFRAETRARKFCFGGAAALGTLQLLVGRFGWFHRYEVYALIFLTLLMLKVLGERPRMWFAYFGLGLMLLASRYVEATGETRYASLQVYEQQWQMRRFVTEFYDGDYAANDIGLMSYQRRPGTYVLDLDGLGSLEMARHPKASAAWLEETVRRHGIGLVVVYSGWYTEPTSWKPMAEMCFEEDPIVAGGNCVEFYSTDVGRRGEIAEELKRFAETTPPGVLITLAE